MPPPPPQATGETKRTPPQATGHRRNKSFAACFLFACFAQAAADAAKAQATGRRTGRTNARRRKVHGCNVYKHRHEKRKRLKRELDVGEKVWFLRIPDYLEKRPMTEMASNALDYCVCEMRRKMSPLCSLLTRLQAM